MTGYEEQYFQNLQYILSKGKWLKNERTGVRCLTVPRTVMEYKLDSKSAPLLSTRPSYPVSACAEILGYIRRYQWATEFAEVGSPTWFDNANKTQDWLDNPTRKGDNHIGKCYGAGIKEEHIRKVFSDLCNGKDGRDLILNWWHPDSFPYSALKPCMNEHQFTIIGDTLDITSSQRSQDYLVGGNFNSLQAYFLGMLGAHLAGVEGGTALHISKHVHIYEPHLEGVEELLSRKTVEMDTTFKIKDWVESYDDLILDIHAREYFTLKGYKGVAQEKIDFEMIA